VITWGKDFVSGPTHPYHHWWYSNDPETTNPSYSEGFDKGQIFVDGELQNPEFGFVGIETILSGDSTIEIGTHQNVREDGYVALPPGAFILSPPIDLSTNEFRTVSIVVNRLFRAAGSPPALIEFRSSTGTFDRFDKTPKWRVYDAAEIVKLRTLQIKVTH